MKYIASALAIAMLVACQQGDPSGDTGETADTALVETASEASQELTVTEGGYPSGESLNGIKEILPSDIKPTFTKETVTKLNAIVRRSLTTIDAYDELRREVKGDPSKGDLQSTKDELAEMDTTAKAALVDIEAEVERLEGSDEVYNEVVLAGMVRFVKDVEAEIEKTYQDGWNF